MLATRGIVGYKQEKGEMLLVSIPFHLAWPEADIEKILLHDNVAYSANSKQGLSGPQNCGGLEQLCNFALYFG